MTAWRSGQLRLHHRAINALPAPGDAFEVVVLINRVLKFAAPQAA